MLNLIKGVKVGRIFNKIDFSGLDWNPNGQQIVALGYRGAYVGSLYSDVGQLFTHEEYENRVTVKNVKWIDRQYIAAGSDTSNIYLWNTFNSEKTIFSGHRKHLSL